MKVFYLYRNKLTRDNKIYGFTSREEKKKINDVYALKCFIQIH